MRSFMVSVLALTTLWAHQSVVNVEALQEAANSGDAQAQFDLGFVYGQGIGVSPDGQKARHWWKRSATSGHAGAQANLGVMLMVDESYEEAADWLQKAVDQNNTLAMCHLAELYATGQGVDEDRQKAAQLAHRGFEAGQRRCQNVWYLYRLDNP